MNYKPLSASPKVPEPQLFSQLNKSERIYIVVEIDTIVGYIHRITYTARVPVAPIASRVPKTTLVAMSDAKQAHEADKQSLTKKPAVTVLSILS